MADEVTKSLAAATIEEKTDEQIEAEKILGAGLGEVTVQGKLILHAYHLSFQIMGIIFTIY